MLGPIGILVGPIAVAFLQAALTMLQTELGSLSVNHVHGTPHNQGNLEKMGESTCRFNVPESEIDA